MTQSKELIELSAFGIDAVDLDMIRRGDMLGPKLGAKVFAALAKLERAKEQLERIAWHEQTDAQCLTIARLALAELDKPE